MLARRTDSILTFSMLKICKYNDGMSGYIQSLVARNLMAGTRLILVDRVSRFQIAGAEIMLTGNWLRARPLVKLIRREVIQAERRHIAKKRQADSLD